MALVDHPRFVVGRACRFRHIGRIVIDRVALTDGVVSIRIDLLRHTVLGTDVLPTMHRLIAILTGIHIHIGAGPEIGIHVRRIEHLTASTGSERRINIVDDRRETVLARKEILVGHGTLVVRRQEVVATGQSKRTGQHGYI